MNKKVAICMRGGVARHTGSYFNPGYRLKPGSLYDNSENPYVNVKVVFNSIKKHILNANPTYDFDFFLQCWNPDLQDLLVNLYQPKKYLFEDNNLYRDEINSKCDHPLQFGMISQSLSISKSIKLKETYEEEVGSTYDIIIIYRYDVLLFKDIILDNYHLGKYVYSNLVSRWYSFLPYKSPVGDFHFIMTNKNSRRFKKIYSWITTNKSYLSITPHGYLDNFISSIGLISKPDDIIGDGYHQDALRKFHVSRLKSLPGITKKDLYYASYQKHNLSRIIDCFLLSIIASILIAGLTYKTFKKMLVVFFVCVLIFMIVLFIGLFFVDIFDLAFCYCVTFIIILLFYKDKQSQSDKTL